MRCVLLGVLLALCLTSEVASAPRAKKLTSRLRKPIPKPEPILQQDFKIPLPQAPSRADTIVNYNTSRVCVQKETGSSGILPACGFNTRRVGEGCISEEHTYQSKYNSGWYRCKRIPVMVIPTQTRGALLARAIESIDFPVDTLVIIRNPCDMCSFRVSPVTCKIRCGDVDRAIDYLLNSHPNPYIHKFPGVATGWNMGLMRHRAPWYLVINDDIAFQKGLLQRIAELVWDHPEMDAFYSNMGHPGGGHSYSAFILTQSGLDRVGYFDENYFPAYSEDCDHVRRLILTGAAVWYTINYFVPIHDKRSSERYRFLSVSGPRRDRSRDKKKMDVTFTRTFTDAYKVNVSNDNYRELHPPYHKFKWGGRCGSEKYQRPFNTRDYPFNSTTMLNPRENPIPVKVEVYSQTMEGERSEKKPIT